MNESWESTPENPSAKAALQRSNLVNELRSNLRSVSAAGSKWSYTASSAKLSAV